MGETENRRGMSQGLQQQTEGVKMNRMAQGGRIPQISWILGVEPRVAKKGRT